MVKMKNLLNGNTWLWAHGKFVDRKYMIQDLYQRYLDGEDVNSIPKEEDPFWEPTEDILIGTADIFLQSLVNAMDFFDQLSITDYKGQEEGKLTVNIIPCTQAGLALDEDNYVEDPKELLKKPFHFKIEVNSAEIHKPRFSKGVKVKYRLLTDKNFTETKQVVGTLSPEFGHSRVISIPKLKEQHLDFFRDNSITFLVYGKQEDAAGDPKLAKLTTKELRQMEQIGSAAESSRRKSVFVHDTPAPDNAHIRTELVLMQRKYERLAQKEKRMMQLCDEWGKKPPEDQQFEPFFRAVSAVAHSTGTRLKTRVQLLNQTDDGDTVSLFVFGEEEESLAKEAERTNGVIDYDKVKEHHFPVEKHSYNHQLARHLSHDGRASNGAKAAGGQAVRTSNGKSKEGSSACQIM
ncbi:kinesin-related protein 1 [Elysia marginata]|uniref:Kinesin-related protein 1 n=1 Tax=Elysia marginata TaxID=1093978 RepID=A0AAV4IGX1_9GAST|nr:kinesin-related protein 1 [Elysia marginata]